MRTGKIRGFGATIWEKLKVRNDNFGSVSKAIKASLSGLCSRIKVRSKLLNLVANSASTTELWVSALALNLEPIS